MTGKGTVVSVHGDSAVVRVRKESACGHDCGECRVCNNPEITTTVLNPIGAAVGDTVTIGTDSRGVLGAAFLLYVLPVFGAIVLGTLVFNLAGVLASAVCIALWAVAWFLFIKRYNASESIRSTIVEVINEEN